MIDDNNKKRQQADLPKYEAMAKEKGFASILHMAASDEMPTWGKVNGKYVIIDTSQITSSMMNKEQKDLLEFLYNDGKIAKEVVKFEDISYNQYVAGSELTEIIRQEKSKYISFCRKP